jgi:putative ABC transport system permease protein
MAAGLRESGVTQHGVAIRPLREVLLGDTRRIAMILAGAVALVLLVAGANLAHLLLGRARARAREFAVRGALGAGRERLLRQVVTETMLLGLLGGVAGVGVAAAMMRWVASAAESPTVAQQASATDVRVVAFALLTALALGLLFGWIPARDATGASPGVVLRRAGLGSFSTARNRLRRALIGVELAFSVVLLSGAGLLVRTVDKLVHEDVGFSADGVLTAAVGLPGSRYPTPEASVRFWDDLTTRVRALPGVQGAGLISQLPFTGDTNGGFDIVGREFPEGESPHAKKRFAGPGLFEALRIPVESGRTFLPSDRLGEPEVAVISEALAEQYWPGEDPVGRRIRFLWQTDGEQEIVGVVGDVRSDALSVAGGGTIYLSSNQIENRYMALVVRASVPPETLAEPVRRSVLAIDPQQPVSNVRTMRSIVRGSVSDRTTVMQLLGAFAVLALVLAALGVYAIATQTVLGRTREIGLRIAVGASPSDILRAVVGHELVPVLIGLAAGLAGAAYAGRFLSGMLYQVSPLDPTTLLVVIGVLLLATLLALTLPAVRTLRVDPVVALRSD